MTTRTLLFVRHGGRGGMVPDTERAFQYLSAVLKAASKSLDDVVRAGVFLTNMTDFAAIEVRI